MGRQPRKFYEGLIGGGAYWDVLVKLLIEFADDQWIRDAIDPAPCLEYLWFWFADLSSDRESGMGLGYIKSTEYEAWARLNRVEISPSELAALKQIDRAFVARKNEPDAPPPNQASEQRSSIIGDLAKIADPKNVKTKKGGKA